MWRWKVAVMMMIVVVMVVMVVMATSVCIIDVRFPSAPNGRPKCVFGSFFPLHLFLFFFLFSPLFLIFHLSNIPPPFLFLDIIVSHSP